jgi:hypothetical protein
VTVSSLPQSVSGAGSAVAAQMLSTGGLSRIARIARIAQPAAVNGAAGIVVAPAGRLWAVIGFTARRSKIVEIDILADPARLRHVDLAVLTG